MRKTFKQVVTWFGHLETKEARRSVAADFKKASQAMFALLLVSMPGAYASVFKALAQLADVKVTGVQVSNFTLFMLGFGSVLLRTLAFLLECDPKQPDKSEKAAKPDQALPQPAPQQSPAVNPNQEVP